jgi:small GTP-binding protein
MAIEIARIRNVGFAGHGGVGKTSLVEAILFRTGTTSRLGRVDDGTATTDFDPEEIKRKISINIGVAHCDYRDHRFNFVDMPGFGDFIAEARAGLRVVEGAVLVVDAVAGVEVQTEKVSKFAQEYGLPRLRQPDGPRARRLCPRTRIDPAAAQGPLHPASRADRPGVRVPWARGRAPDEGVRPG